MPEIDVARRHAVMERSRKLGHCICNPAHPCPCPPLIEQNICPCAGERPQNKVNSVALTQHVRKAGCASKIGQADLWKILGTLPEVTDPRVLLGTAAGDDAGVYLIDTERALVQTVDVFTPCVDDPYLFGQIAAANSVSDIYAMGGTPLTALSIVGFPIDKLDGDIMAEMLRGGMDKLQEAGCALIGGHSINDEEIKCGFAVTGLIDPKAVVARDQAQAGDVLVLTKPLGTGMIAFAAQLGLVSEACLAEAGAWMAALNRDAAELMAQHGAHACTDITGFGLAGHLVAMLRGSGLNADLDLSAVPVFGVVPECIARGVYSGAVDGNQAYSMSFVKAPAGGNGTRSGLPVLFDPQTSGGLLIALPEPAAKAFIRDMHARGHAAASIIGHLSAQEPDQASCELRVETAKLEHLIGPRELMPAPRIHTAQAPTPSAAASHACCDDPPAPAPEPGKPLDIFKQFMAEANRPGLIDARSKKLMAIALSIGNHCEPCLKSHLDSARTMGITKAEMDEAALLAISFGGCTAMVLYNETCKKIGLRD